MKDFLNYLIEDFNKSLIIGERYKFILSGMGNTLLITLFSIIIGITLALISIIIIFYRKETGKFKILTKFINLYITIIRSTPIVLQLMIMYFVIFNGIRNVNLIFVASLTFGINSSAYLSEVFRAGIESIDVGQNEAGRALGLSYFQTMKLIILPQAIKKILPAMGNELIAILKTTSVSGYIGITDLTKASDIIASRTYEYAFPLILVAVIYLSIIMLVKKIFAIFERK